MKPSEDGAAGTTPTLDFVTSVFPTLLEDKLTELRSYISSSIQQLLGEEEVTLIDFIQNHVTSQQSIASLLPELEQVLEEDARTFVQSLWEKIYQLKTV